MQCNALEIYVKQNQESKSACLHLCNFRAGYVLQLFQMEVTISKNCGLQPTRAMINTIQQEKEGKANEMPSI